MSKISVFFSEITEQLTPTVVEITISLLKNLFQMGINYVHEHFIVRPKHDETTGLFQCIGFEIEAKNGYVFDKKIDLCEQPFLHFKVDETPEIENVEAITTDNQLIIRIENFVYIYKK